MAETPPDTRARILQVAMDEFAARGYHATSVREIAERVGVTKTAVLYHFPGKADIVGALAEPMLADLDAAMAAAGLPDPAGARWAAIEGLLDVWLAHRYLLRMNLYDLALAATGTVFRRFRDGMMRANTLVAGPDPDFDGRVRAAQAIAMLSDPVVLFADAPVEALRAAVLRGVHRLLGDAGPRSRTATGPDTEPAEPTEPAAPAARVRPGRGRRGRPGVMSPSMADTARRMYAAGSTATEIAAALGVSRATVYRHLTDTDH
ncbi:TetR family transcriptional regulator [Sphaerisporangium perillae]|uniref:TetR family transcriptional regulator n=1 Tax=Sphaerisporangium perillae TaxID=2935860 RepID=UPI00200D4732|nr:TetR family transcriptional regulator [Sphaerisporangium perillae]